jgi:hypothetical protein
MKCTLVHVPHTRARTHTYTEIISSWDDSVKACNQRHIYDVYKCLWPPTRAMTWPTRPQCMSHRTYQVCKSSHLPLVRRLRQDAHSVHVYTESCLFSQRLEYVIRDVDLQEHLHGSVVGRSSHMAHVPSICDNKTLFSYMWFYNTALVSTRLFCGCQKALEWKVKFRRLKQKTLVSHWNKSACRFGRLAYFCTW